MTLTGRIALVTGATRGLGNAIAEQLAQAGAKVAMNFAHNAEQAEIALAQVRQSGEAALFQGDALSEEGVDALVASVRAHWGEIDTVVINATPAQYELPIEDYTDPQIQSMLQAFLMGPHYLTKAVMGPMKEAKFGRIINITSEVFDEGNANFSAYGAAKGAQVGYLRSTAMELAPHGITVNGVAPGWIPVERHEEVPQENKDGYLATIPLGRWGTREDIAAAVLFFASKGAGFITGQNLSVNGGRTLC